MPSVFLIVDDSQTSRVSLIHALEMTGIPIAQVYQAANGKEALEVLGKQWIDMVFTDLNMPVMAGDELLKAIRSNPVTSELAVAVITSEGGQAHLNELKELGATHICRKPFRAEMMKEMLIKSLGDWS
jgi:two-component system chemotaxis response regulator CheY